MERGDFKRLNFKEALRLFFSFSLGVWVQAIINFFSIPVITFLISPEEFGKSTMYSTIYSFLLVIILAGFDQSFVRFFYEVGENKRSVLFWTSLFPPLTIVLIISLLLYRFNESLSLFLIGDKNHPIAALVSLSVITGLLQTYNLAVIRMQKKGFLYSMVFVTQSIVNVGVTILYALFFGRNFYAIVWGQIFGNAISFLVGTIFEHSNLLPVKVDLDLLKKLAIYGLPLLPSALLWWLFQWVSRFFLRTYSTFTELGYFGVAFKLSYVMYLINSGFQNFWFPVAYETYEKDRENRKLFIDAANVISFVMVLFALFVITFKDLLFYIMAKDYRPASLVLPFLLFPPVISSILAVTARGINFLKKTYWFIVSDGICLLINSVLNYLMVSKLGARGSAISTGLSFIVLLTIEAFISMRLYPVKYPLKKIYTAIGILWVASFIATFVRDALIVGGVSLLAIFALCLVYSDLVKIGIKEVRKFLKKP
ncbi:MAG: oligosaccharide flippase family protein [bacterium]|nr:oligosaccharide flippase family protein [bacterium]